MPQGLGTVAAAQLRDLEGDVLGVGGLAGLRVLLHEEGVRVEAAVRLLAGLTHDGAGPDDDPAGLGDLRVDADAHLLTRVDGDRLAALLGDAGGDVLLGEDLALAVAAGGGLGLHRRRTDGHGRERCRLLAGGEGDETQGHGTDGGSGTAALAPGDQRSGHTGRLSGAPAHATPGYGVPRCPSALRPPGGSAYRPAGPR